MTIHVGWGNENKTVLINVYEGMWNLDDFYASVQQTNALLGSVNHKVNMIIDVQKSGLFPKGMMSAVRILSNNPHPNNGIMALIGINAFVRVFYDLFMKLYPQRGNKQVMYLVANYEDAYAIFARYANPTPNKSEQPLNR